MRRLWLLLVTLLLAHVAGVGGRAARGTPCPTDSSGTECSGHGLCRRGRCLCDPGYSGSACTPAREKPGLGRDRLKDARGRPKYGRDYAAQLKADLAREMERRRAENDERMRKLREQFRDQNKNIEQASAGVKEKLEKARIDNTQQIEEMQEQRAVEVEEITKNTERIREQVDGVGEGLKEQLKAEYDAVANQAAELSDKAKEDYVEPPRPPELDGEDKDTPYSLDLFLTAADDMYDVVPLDIEDETLFEDDGWQAYRASVLAKRMSAGNHVAHDETDSNAAVSGGGVDTEVAAAMASLGIDGRRPPPPAPLPKARPPPPPAPQKLEVQATTQTYDVVELADDEDDDFL